MNLNIFLVPDSAACMIFLHHGRDNFWAFPPFLRASEGDRFGMFARAHEKLEPPKSYPECAAMHKHPIAKFWTQATELMVKVMERSCLNLSAGIHMNMFSWLDPTQHNIFISHSV